MRADLQTFMTHSLTLITQIFNTEKGLLLCLILKCTDCFKSPVKLTTPTSTIYKFSSSGSWKRVSQSRGLALSSAEHDSGVCLVSVCHPKVIFYQTSSNLWIFFSFWIHGVHVFSQEPPGWMLGEHKRPSAGRHGWLKVGSHPVQTLLEEQKGVTLRLCVIYLNGVQKMILFIWK